MIVSETSSSGQPFSARNTTVDSHHMLMDALQPYHSHFAHL